MLEDKTSDRGPRIFNDEDYKFINKLQNLRKLVEIYCLFFGYCVLLLVRMLK